MNLLLYSMCYTTSDIIAAQPLYVCLYLYDLYEPCHTEVAGTLKYSHLATEAYQCGLVPTRYLAEKHVPIFPTCTNIYI